MKKIYVIITLLLPLVIAVFINVKIGTKMSDATSLTLKNIEALADGEEGTTCPDYNYVPNRYIVAKPGKISAQCNVAGQIVVNDSTITGSFTYGTSYNVNIETKNCSGTQKGACCDQRQVGVHILSIG